MASKRKLAVSEQVLAYSQRVQAIAQAGLAFSTSHYDLDRYVELRELSVALVAALSDEPVEKIVRVFASETGYQTPKVDIRAVVFRGKNQILLVGEKSDGNRWTLPGGWADIGYTPFETAEKETREETGLLVKAVRLLALLDKREHGHPAQPWYIYKAFILCEEQGGELIAETAETLGARWVRREELSALDLSLDRVMPSQFEMLFRFAENPGLPTICD